MKRLVLVLLLVGTLPISASVFVGPTAASPDPFSQVSAGYWHTCGLRTDGSLACWGDNYWGQATPPTGTFTEVSAGAYHTCALRTDGTPACWGLNGFGQATPPTGTLTKVSTGWYHNCGLRADGSLACWGYNNWGQATPPTGTFTEVSAGAYHTCALRTAGTLACWGDNSHGQATPPFTVDSTGDAPDSNTSDGLCDDGTGACTLRAAIQQANQTPGADRINFGIGTGVQTISPLSALPSIDDPVTIDGTTQPGFAGSPIIELSGAGAGPGVEGLTLAGGGSTVQGLAINRFTSAGVSITSDGNVVRGNFVGTDVSGAAVLGNGGNAITIDAAADNTIGGTAPWERNVMSGNSGNGILIVGDSATGNVVEGNFIGTDATGTLDLGNTFAGVGILNSASHNTIGGTAPGAGNVVSGNGTIGVGMGAGGVCTDNVVQGNRIGTDVTGTLPIGNGLDGVGTSGLNNTVGGSTSEARNIIAFNGRNGVSVDAVFSNGTGNIVRGNSIFSNTALGIDLSVDMGPDGVTANDAGDGDTGANNLQNYPVLTSAVGGSTTVQGTLNSTPSTQFTLEFFHSGACDPSGFGEGESFLGSATVETDAGGDASFSVEFAESVPAGRFITATATDSAGNTSEFSQCIAAAAASPGDVNRDGQVAMVDAMLIAQCVAGLIDCDSIDREMADVNCAGGVSMVDAMLIAQYVAGLIDEFPCYSPGESEVCPGHDHTVALLVDPAVSAGIRSALSQFESDLCNEGYSIVEKGADFAAPPDLRSYLAGLYLRTDQRLAGAILIGELPHAYQWFTVTYTNPHIPPWSEEVISFQYYADLDGTFEASPEYVSPSGHSYSYDLHSGEMDWEIWIGVLPYYRGNLAVTVEAINAYFAKNHAYRTGGYSLPRGFLQIDEHQTASTESEYFSLLDLLRSGQYAWTPFSSALDARIYFNSPPGYPSVDQGYQDLSAGVADFTVADAHGSWRSNGRIDITWVESSPVQTAFFWAGGCSTGNLDYPENFLTSVLYSSTSMVLLAEGTTNESGGIGTNVDGFYGHNIASALSSGYSVGDALLTHVNAPLALPWSLSREFHFAPQVMLGDPTLRIRQQSVRNARNHHSVNSGAVGDGPGGVGVNPAASTHA